MPITYFPPAVIDSGTGSDWGMINGNIGDQNDLFSLLSAKSDVTHNHAGIYEPANSSLLKHLALVTNNCENTDAEVSLFEITIPGGSMQDGDVILINYAFSTYQNSSSDNDLTIKKKTDTDTFVTKTYSIGTSSDLGNNNFKELLMRRGNKLLSFSLVDSMLYLDYIFSQDVLNSENFGGESTTLDFTDDIVFKLTAQWSATHANSFIRVLAASAFNSGGQST